VTLEERIADLERRVAELEAREAPTHPELTVHPEATIPKRISSGAMPAVRLPEPGSILEAVDEALKSGR
jgi:hypothetical protein